jgi:hypothetical protein
LWNDVPLPAGEAYGYLTTPVISTGTWHLLEFQATISPTAGEARLWLDGNLEVEETGLDLGSNPIDRYAAGIYWTNPRTEANLLYFDEAALVQWVDPAPSTGLGGEEASGCAATATPTNTPLPTNTPTNTPLPTSTPTPTATTASGLVAHWEFDEGSGQTAADSSGTGNAGTLGTTGGADSADPAWVCVSGGNALNFDGVDDQVLAPDYDVLSTISISTWIKWDVVGASEGIISKRTDTEVAGNWALRGDNTTPGYLEWMVWSGLDSSQSLLTSTAITPGVWTHVALTFNDSTNAVNFYIDGAPNSSGTISNNLANTPQPIVIGWSGQGGQFFDGSIDDMRVYNRVLTPAEITALAATPPTGCTSLQFDGTNDLVTLVDLPTWTDFTVETWVKRTVDSSDFATFLSDANAGYSQAMFSLYVDLNNSDCPAAPADEFAYWQVGDAFFCSGVAANLGAWHHVAVTRNGTTRRFYVDGTLVNTAAGSPSPPASNGLLAFGVAGQDQTEYFGGLMDEVRLSDIARYTGASFTPPTTPFTSDGNTVGLWHLNEGSGQVVGDSSANGRNGVLGTTASVQTSDPTWSADSPVSG